MGKLIGAESGSRVLVIGLDCAAPELVFGNSDFDLPNLRGLMDGGAFGVLKSCDPPITVPAWACMMSGRDPGALGVYGFRNRREYGTYGDYRIATSLNVGEPRVWDILSEAGKQVCVVGVPQTYPVSEVKGCMVSGILTPGMDVECTWPGELREELVGKVGEIQFDVTEFRTDDKYYLLKQINEFRINRFAVARYLMQNKPWDFFMMVDMGVDRLHHGFWRYCDPGHPRFEEGNPWRSAIRDYYGAMDAEIGRLLEIAGAETEVMVVSDHGAKAMHGGVRVNQWLMDEGFLVLKDAPDAPRALSVDDVDWSRTQAWGEGGYYGRIFLNVRGREAEGIVEEGDIGGVRERIRIGLERMRGPDGVVLWNKVYYPEELYPEVRGIAPDLMVYFGGLHWRSLGEVGCDSIFAETNDTGPDDANHAMEGLVILKDGKVSESTNLEGAQLMDIAPTVLDWMGVPVPESMQGKVLGR